MTPEQRRHRRKLMLLLGAVFAAAFGLGAFLVARLRSWPLPAALADTLAATVPGAALGAMLGRLEATVAPPHHLFAMTPERPSGDRRPSAQTDPA